MEKINFSTGIIDDSSRKKLIKKLSSNEEILKLLRDKNIPEEEIELHPYKLNRYLEAKKQCLNCLGLKHCKQKQKGYYESLSYHSVLEDELVRCDYALEKDEAEKHLKYYLIRDFGNDFTTAFFGKINLKNEDKKYISVLSSVIKAYNNKEGVYLYGNMGTGKTYLSACALNEAAKNKRKVAFVQCSRLSERISNYHIDSKTEVDRLMYADFVVFDDIGAEEVSEKYRSVLLSILDARMQNHLMTWFTSNEDYKTLLEHYTFSNKSEDKYEAMRIIERIQTLSKPIELIAEDRRILHLK